MHTCEEQASPCHYFDDPAPLQSVSLPSSPLLSLSSLCSPDYSGTVTQPVSGVSGTSQNLPAPI